jgi:LuxR family transcriptional regulator, quorum-sensing system regulator SdiA
MNQRASIAAMLHEFDDRSPAGFAIALHIRFTTPTYLFQTYPKRWMDHYAAAGFVIHDPTVRWGLNNLGHIRWSALESIDGAGVLERAKDFGIMNGVTTSVLIADSRSIASFARADREYEECEMAEIEESLGQLHRATLTPGELSPSDRKALTELSIRLSH